MEKQLYIANNSKDGYNLWMAYPACKAFALASLGYLWLAKIADETQDIRVQKVYTDTESFDEIPQ